VTQQAQPLADSWRAWWDYELRRPSGGGPIARLNQLSQRWEVLVELVVRGLKASYGGSFLGYAWTLLNPLLMIGIYALIFGTVTKLNITNYALFIAAGQMPWQFFNGCINSSMGSLRSNSGVIRTINMPREIFPLAVVGEELIELMLSLPLVFLLGAAFGVLPSHYVLLLPVAVLIETVLVIGLALLLASLATVVRDTQRVVRPILRMLFFLSPVIFPLSRAKGGLLLLLYHVNPLVGILELTRLTWYPNYLVSPSAVFLHAAISAAVAVAMLIIGWATFIRLEPAVLKEL
jgi:ABC-2 type transport system permease protein